MATYINGSNQIQYNPSTAAIERTPESGTYHLAATDKLYDIQRSNNFELEIPGLDGIQRIGSTQTITNGSEVLRLSVTASDVPHFNQSQIEIRRGNSVLKYAGIPTFNTINITCNDYIGLETKELLMSWQNLSYNVTTEKVGLATDYKKICYLKEYSPDYQLVRTWKMYGCWISDLNEPGYNSESGDKHTVSFTLQYDRATLDTD